MCNFNFTNQRQILFHNAEEDLSNACEMEKVIRQWDNWEENNNNFNYCQGEYLVDVKFANSNYYKDYGWKDQDGKRNRNRLKKW